MTFVLFSFGPKNNRKTWKAIKRKRRIPFTALNLLSGALRKLGNNEIDILKDFLLPPLLRSLSLCRAAIINYSSSRFLLVPLRFLMGRNYRRANTFLMFQCYVNHSSGETLYRRRSDFDEGANGISHLDADNRNARPCYAPHEISGFIETYFPFVPKLFTLLRKTKQRMRKRRDQRM